ncbi:hypothetical protein [Kitasatospora sp. NPDC088134]|uniref:hypothetical protein n=1 Tax=Kitasatospora sp. NPDC088134 TaxID=3364071 RepID=UPI00382B99C4
MILLLMTALGALPSAVGVGYVLLGVRTWRNERPTGPEGRFRRSLRINPRVSGPRVYLPIGVSLTAMGVFFPVAALLPGDPLPAAVAWVLLALLVLFVGAMGCYASVSAFNRPKFAVPPHLRQEPGTVTRWWRERRRRARKRSKKSGGNAR